MPSESSSESYAPEDEDYGELAALIRRQQIRAYSDAAVLERLAKDSAAAIDKIVAANLNESAGVWVGPNICACSHQEWNHEPSIPRGRCMNRDCNCQQYARRAA